MRSAWPIYRTMILSLGLFAYETRTRPSEANIRCECSRKDSFGNLADELTRGSRQLRNGGFVNCTSLLELLDVVQQIWRIGGSCSTHGGIPQQAFIRLASKEQNTVETQCSRPESDIELDLIRFEA
jgi:hypothetical protein